MNPFFRTANSGYGENWKATSEPGEEVKLPAKLSGVPEYKDFGERELALNTSLKTYQHKVLAQMREDGELDSVGVYDRIKHEKDMIKKQDVVPKAFPAQGQEMKYPEPALKAVNPLWKTSSQNYGGKKPVENDMPNAYFPKNNQFTTGFLGGNFHDTGLNTCLLYTSPSPRDS